MYGETSSAATANAAKTKGGIRGQGDRIKTLNVTIGAQKRKDFKKRRGALGWGEAENQS